MNESGPLIVVVDDNPDILQLINTRLSKRGYDVLTATDGRQALDLIRQRRPDAVVLDWFMPEMQGPEVCSALKEDTDTGDIPIILLTAKASESDVSTGFERGADEYLTKPFEIEELDQTLRRLLSS
ncbi:MAG: PleD family two-component system response regulator [Actinomycetota bacterium]